MNENEIGLDYQPDWKEEYQKAVDLHCLTLDELREANFEIKRLKAMVESQDMILVRSAERIVDLQDEIRNLTGDECFAIGFIAAGNEFVLHLYLICFRIRWGY